MEMTPGLRREPAPDLDAVGEDEALAARIRDEIRRDGPMPFARFMDLALYDPDGGYYRGAEPRPGRAGDFLTAPEAHPIFGRAVARVLDETWRRLGEPARFVLREYGAGEGALALAILDGLRRDGSGLASALRYDPIDIEARRIDAIASRLAEAGFVDTLLPPDERDAPIVGTVLANEVLDALPVHRVRRRGDALVELAVGLDDGRFVEVGDRADDAGAGRPARGRRASSSSTARRRRSAWRSTAGSRTRPPGSGRGLLLLIDYGHAATDLYDPVRRRDGTLRAYVRHRVHDDPYRHVGRQDLTAHVDVTAVERAAAAAGLAHLGHDDPGRVPRRGRHRRAAARDPGRPGHVARGVPRGPVGVDAPARSGRDGSLPGDGIRARLARRPAAGGARLPPAGALGPRVGRCLARRPPRTAPDYGDVPIAAHLRRRARFAMVGHDLTGSGARTCTRARRAPLPDASFTAAGAPSDPSPSRAERALRRGVHC